MSAAALFPLALAGAQPAIIPLWPEGVPGLRADAAPDKDTASSSSEIHTPTMTFYPAPADVATGAAVVVCPGGGYARLSMDNEGRKVAAWLNSIGVSAFVLKYRLKEYGQPAPLRDVLRALRIVRSRAADFGVKDSSIGVLGFSAGGHLASSATTLYNHPDGKTGNKMDDVSARPDFSVLVYPVISMRAVAHKGSRENLIGKNPPPELVSLYSTDEQVTADTPPVFLVSGSDDKTVPVENSVQFYLALRKAGVPAEMHLYQKAAHGFGMKPNIGPPAGWTQRCEDWLRLNGWLPAKPRG